MFVLEEITKVEILGKTKTHNQPVIGNVQGRITDYQNIEPLEIELRPCRVIFEEPFEGKKYPHAICLPKIRKV